MSNTSNKKDDGEGVSSGRFGGRGGDRRIATESDPLLLQQKQQQSIDHHSTSSNLRSRRSPIQHNNPTVMSINSGVGISRSGSRSMSDGELQEPMLLLPDIDDNANNNNNTTSGQHAATYMIPRNESTTTGGSQHTGIIAGYNSVDDGTITNESVDATTNTTSQDQMLVESPSIMDPDASLGTSNPTGTTGATNSSGEQLSDEHQRQQRHFSADPSLLRQQQQAYHSRTAPAGDDTYATNTTSTTSGQTATSTSATPPPAPIESYRTRSHGGGGSTTAGGTQYDTETSAMSPPILEIPEEIYAVRKAALKVLKPLNKTWVVISVGFALTVLFGMARWTRLLPQIPFWFIVLPCWSAHVGLLWLHVLSAKALSSFIAEANESRQRPDSRDHMNRTEYLPLLQRSLKFGLKTGLLSFCVFLFEVLIYIRVAKQSISLSTAFLPLWILVLCGIVDGLVCKTQHYLRVVCWILTFLAMALTVLKVDYGWDGIRWRQVVSPIVTVLSIASCSLIYIVYGHQIGYYRLTESQLTAGNLYSLAALICIVLIVMIGEVIPLSRPVEIETRLFVVILAPLVVSLVGMGAWVVSRDEFGRLLLFGGQSAVHPMRLKWEGAGWTSVQGKGVTIIPMFGEVSFCPLEKRPAEHAVEMMTCCTTCYPYVEDDDNDMERGNMPVDDYHPYLDASPATQRKNYRAIRGEGV